MQFGTRGVFFMTRITRTCVRWYSNVGVGKKYDAVVVGGGHNGLVAAAYLQKNGFKVSILDIIFIKQ